MTDAVVAREVLSEGEERFERIRKIAGAIIAPLVFIVILLLPMPSLKPQAHRLAAVMAAVMVLWLTEALPMPVTAMAGAAFCVLLNVAKAKEVFAPFADPLIFLFIGSFIIARAIFLHRLDRRLAFAVLSLKGVGARPTRILVAFGAVTAFLSAWIANTAATAMMFAIGLSVLAFLFEQRGEGGAAVSRRYATGLMLMTTFAASIGGLATPIGTAPNLIGIGFIREKLGIQFPFFKWCMIGVPVVIVLYIWLATYLGFLCRAGVKEIAGSREMLLNERRRLGPWRRGEVSTIFAFALTVVLWVTPGIVALIFGDSSKTYLWLAEIMPEGVVALVGAMLLFILPGEGSDRAINWIEASKIDWGVVFLYGGGLALGTLSFSTGLAEQIGTKLTTWLPINGSENMMLIMSCVVAVLVSETTSNTASANMVVPIVIALAQSAGVDPLAPALGATMSASLGFMLPVSTPCNAIVYGSGYVPLGKMVRYGLLLDVVGVVVIVAAIKFLLPLLR